MPEYLSPGVYVEEVDTGSKPIEGVSTSTTGMVGLTLRGPSTGLPVLVTSFADFKRKFGGYFDFGSSFKGYQFLPHAVEGFFVNGGKRLYIKRVPGSGAAASTKQTTGGLITRLTSDTSSSTPKKAKLVTLRGIIGDDGTHTPTKLKFTQDKKGIVTTEAAIAVDYCDRKTGEVTLKSPLTNVYEAKYTTVAADYTPSSFNSFKISAKDEGSWGDEIDIRVYHESAASSEMIKLVSDPGNKIELRSAKGFYVDAWVEIDLGRYKFFRKITKINSNVITVDGAALVAADVAFQAPATSTVISACEFRVSASYEGISEDFRGLTLENVPGSYYYDIINNSSELISVQQLTTTSSPTMPTVNVPLYYPSADDGLYIILGGGGDGTCPGDADYKGTDNGPGNRSGIQALGDIDQVSIVAVPGITSQTVQDALITHCELLKDRFAILDPKPKSGNAAPDLTDIQDQRKLFDTKYAAIYYPRILMQDPLSDQTVSIAIPPSGHLAGIYARSDIERGVHKAPANEVIRGITGLEVIVNKGEQDILNPLPNNINVLRDFRSSGRSYRVWGARCMTSDGDWKYINVRRLFIFIEESIDEGTQWVVFEPNDEPTWARVRRSVTHFLTNIWRDGALQGKKSEEAFFVKCDRTTMTQTDIDNGKLIMLIGIAPVKPAEFVIFRIGQWSGGSEVEEI